MFHDRFHVIISIHALHEESDLGLFRGHPRLPISIHALHEESDEEYRLTVKGIFISIHALHEESDPLANQVSGLVVYFNPRSP